MLQRPSKYEAGPQKCCQELANKIEGNWGCYLGTQPMGGGGETEDGTIYMINIHTVEDGRNPAPVGNYW